MKALHLTSSDRRPNFAKVAELQNGPKVDVGCVSSFRVATSWISPGIPFQSPGILS